MPLLPADLPLTDDLQETLPVTPADHAILNWWGETTLNLSVKPMVQISLKVAKD